MTTAIFLFVWNLSLTVLQIEHCTHINIFLVFFFIDLDPRHQFPETSKSRETPQAAAAEEEEEDDYAGLFLRIILNFNFNINFNFLQSLFIQNYFSIMNLFDPLFFYFFMHFIFSLLYPVHLFFHLSILSFIYLLIHFIFNYIDSRGIATKVFLCLHLIFHSFISIFFIN